MILSVPRAQLARTRAVGDGTPRPITEVEVLVEVQRPGRRGLDGTDRSLAPSIHATRLPGHSRSGPDACGAARTDLRELVGAAQFSASRPVARGPWSMGGRTSGALRGHPGRVQDLDRARLREKRPRVLPRPSLSRDPAASSIPRYHVTRARELAVRQGEPWQRMEVVHRVVDEEVVEAGLGAVGPGGQLHTRTTAPRASHSLPSASSGRKGQAASTYRCRLSTGRAAPSSRSRRGRRWLALGAASSTSPPRPNGASPS